jgi:hypothetical protein
MCLKVGVAEVEELDVFDDVHGGADLREAVVDDEHVVDVTPVPRPARPLFVTGGTVHHRHHVGLGLEVVTAEQCPDERADQEPDGNSEECEDCRYEHAGDITRL